MLVVFCGTVLEIKDHNIKNTFLKTIVLVVVAGILLDISTFICSYYFPESKFIYPVFVASMISPNIWVALMIYYLVSFIVERHVGSWKIAHAGAFLMGLNVVMIIVLAATGNLFSIDEGYVLPESAFSYPGYVLIFVCLVYFSICILYRKQIGKQLSSALILYVMIIACAFAVDNIFDGIVTQYFAEALSVLICFIMVKHQEIRQNNNNLSDANRQLEGHIEEITKLNHNLEEQMEIINSMGKIYFSSFYIDLMNDTFEEISSINTIRNSIGKVGKDQESLFKMSAGLVLPEFSEGMREFVDLSTINKRLKNKDFISFDYMGISTGWSQAYLIAGDRNVKGDLKHLFIATRIIHEEKAREEAQNKALEEALEAAKAANIAKTMFLSRMSHDIRTPLNGIIGLLEISEKHADDRELIDANRQKEKVAANHLLALISDVLELTKLDDENVRLTHEAFDLMALVDDVMTIIQLKAKESGITIDMLDFADQMAVRYVFGSPLHVRQILLNILGNAVKYNKPNGKIVYKTSLVDCTPSTVTYKIVISDTGIGMGPEFIKHIFEPFSQERADARSIYQGTGLGMSICKSLVEKMGGSISVQSRIGEGSTFEVIIPFSIATKDDLPTRTKVENIEIKGTKVLLVEDNELNMEIAETILNDAGAVVTKAPNGWDAVNLFSKTEPGTFDVILMDLMMPMMDGFEATKVIRTYNRADAKTIPIIAMTANAFAEDAQKCFEIGMNEHVGKPINVQDLMEKIARVTGRI